MEESLNAMFMDFLWAFIVGGLLCAIGQVLIDYTKLTPARILVSYVVAGVVLGAFGLYDPIVKLAGAGATVPLTGFGNNLVLGVKQAIAEKGFLGIFTGGFTASAAGVATAILSGLTVALIFKPKEK
jgi:stage V sporulation protein AE